MKFRKKPVVIEAIKWINGDNDSLKNILAMGCQPEFAADGTPDLMIPIFEGRMRANVGDWIIKGVNGEFYPCKPDIFEKTYDKVE